MKEFDKKIMIKSGLIGFFFFFGVLILIDANYEPRELKINEIEIKNINQYVKTSGKIVKQNLYKNSTLFLEIEDNKTIIPAIMFKANSTIPYNKNYSFIGKVTLYKNKPEIIIYEIREK